MRQPFFSISFWLTVIITWNKFWIIDSYETSESTYHVFIRGSSAPSGDVHMPINLSPIKLVLEKFHFLNSHAFKMVWHKVFLLDHTIRNNILLFWFLYVDGSRANNVAAPSELEHLISNHIDMHNNSKQVTQANQTQPLNLISRSQQFLQFFFSSQISTWRSQFYALRLNDRLTISAPRIFCCSGDTRIGALCHNNIVYVP